MKTSLYLSNLAKALLSLFLLATFSCVAQDDNGKGRLVALVAAASEYPGNAALYESDHNAGRISESLTSVGFDVTKLSNFSKADFEKSFQDWCQATADAEVAVIYVCAHGGSINEENYFFPIGTDVTAPSQMPDQCIGFRSLLESLSGHQKSEKRLNLLIVDGSRPNPFLARTVGFEKGSANYSAYYSLPYLPANTIMISPTGSGQVLDRKDTTILVDSLNEKLFKNDIQFREGLDAAMALIREKSGDKLDPNVSVEFDGTLAFYSVESDKQTTLSISEEKPKTPVRFSELREASQRAVEEGDVETAIKALLTIYDEIPEQREVVESDLRSILTSSSMENPFLGKQLLESEEFDFQRLAEPPTAGDDMGIGLKEARRVIWSSGKWFLEHRELAKKWAKYDAEQGTVEAMRVSGELHLKENTEENDKIAADWFKKASEKDDILSIVWMGQLHQLGRGLPKSNDLAEKAYLKVKEMGDPRGAAGLGELERERLQGLDPPGDHSKAVELYKDAVKGEFYKPAPNLAVMLIFNYTGVPVDKKEAARILLEGAEVGVDSRCMWVLFAMLEKKIFDDAKDALELIPEEKRKDLLRHAADLGYPDAVKYAQRNGIDYLGSAKALCEKRDLNYQLWKLDQRNSYTALQKK